MAARTVLVAALLALSTAAAGADAARLRSHAPSALAPSAQADLDAAYAANAADLASLKAAAARKDALLQASSSLSPQQARADVPEGEVQPEIEPNPAAVRLARERQEQREETLTAEGRKALESENEFHAHLMDGRAARAVKGLLNRLLAAQTFVRLYQPVRGGHLVRYRVVRGSAAAVQSFAAEFGIHATASELSVVPADGSAHVRASAVEANQHNAGVVPQPYRPGTLEDEDSPAMNNFPEFVDKEVSSGERLELAANNKHETGKLACPVCEKFGALTFRLARDDTFIRLYGAIPHGHTADYELVRGSRAAVAAVAAEVGLQATNSQLTAAPTERDSVHAEAEVTHGFEAATTNEGAGEPIN